MLTIDTAKRIVWTFIQAFFPAFLTLASGFTVAPNLKTGKAIFIGAAIGAFAAGLSAVKNLFIPEGSPLR